MAQPPCAHWIGMLPATDSNFNIVYVASTFSHPVTIRSHTANLDGRLTI